MATQEKRNKLELGPAFENARAQFRGLNPKEPGQWPLLPRLAAWAAVALAVLAALWFVWLSDHDAQLEVERGREPTLKADYRAKLGQAINLTELRKQKSQVEEYVTQLEKQLPGKAEMDALLSDINQAGLGRGLQFELFRPGQVAVKDYYAELPIAVKVSGRYHDIGAFASDVANLSRIVTLNNLSIVAPPRETGNAMSMEAVARTYRYLDPTEVEEQRKARAEAAAKANKK